MTLVDGTEAVLQFRTEPLDLDAFKTARGSLGSTVPDARALEHDELIKERVWAYFLTRLHGKMWVDGVAGEGAEGRIAINRSLGRVFSKGYLSNSSSEAVNGNIRPHLEAILASPLQEIVPYRNNLQDYLDKLGQLERLPLWVAHYDLNEVNILIDKDCHVTDLVDWELSSPLPFGVGFGRIHTLASEYTAGEFWRPDEFEVAERAFWNELFNGMPLNIRDMLKKEGALVQDAVLLGTLLDCFIFEGGKVGFSQVTIKALPKFLTYWLPYVRGNEGPYKV